MTFLDTIFHLPSCHIDLCSLDRTFQSRFRMFSHANFDAARFHLARCSRTPSKSVVCGTACEIFYTDVPYISLIINNNLYICQINCFTLIAYFINVLQKIVSSVLFLFFFFFNFWLDNDFVISNFKSISFETSRI